ncbi:hypothetical protein GCM10009634_39620 [Saccharothrix xinjiangensis]
MTNLCLEVPDSSTESNKPVRQALCSGGTNQWWEFVPSTSIGYGQYRNVSSRMCLEVRDGSDSPGATIQQNHCADVPNQKWYYDSSTGYLRPLHSSGNCAAAVSSQNLAAVRQYPCSPAGTVFPFWQTGF